MLPAGVRLQLAVSTKIKNTANNGRTCLVTVEFIRAQRNRERDGVLRVLRMTKIIPFGTSRFTVSICRLMDASAPCFCAA